MDNVFIAIRLDTLPVIALTVLHLDVILLINLIEVIDRLVNEITRKIITPAAPGITLEYHHGSLMILDYRQIRTRSTISRLAHLLNDQLASALW